jgi:hypothetical protein
MNRRYLAAMTVAAALIPLLNLAPLSVAGQTAQTPATPKTVLRTAWGEPDLQGIWANEFATPLQRPAKYANKEFFTEEERADLDRQRAGMRTFSDRAAPRGTEQDVAGAYNAVFQSIRPTGRRTSLIVDPKDGRMPAYTEEYQKRQATWRAYQLDLMRSTQACKNGEPSCRGGKYDPTPSPNYHAPQPIYPLGNVNRSDGPEDHSLSVRCMGGFMPAGGEGTTFSSGQNGFTRRIVQTPGGIAMFYDTGQGQSWQRPTIVMNGSPHLPAHMRLWWGDSRGRWEGDTLVIDVTNFTPKTIIFGARENVHIVERFRRTDAKTLEYTVTLEDPTTWVRPWTAKVEYTKQDDFTNRIYTDNRCHEGNYGLPGLLRGARTEEKNFKEGKGPEPATICITACGEKLGADEDQTADPFDAKIPD